MPAAAVIPALRVYMNVVVVKKHIADNVVSASGPCSACERVTVLRHGESI